MHHLACKRYGEAASDLLVVNKEEQDLAQKHVRLSQNTIEAWLTGSCLVVLGNLLLLLSERHLVSRQNEGSC
jgi:hypothetical protein